MSVCVIGNPEPNMSTFSSGGGSSSPAQSKLSLSVEKVLEKAQATGVIDLGGRNLKTFPKSGCRYRLKDTVVADLSRNKLAELPSECTDYWSLERLVLYHNTIRGIPESLVCLQALQYLDLSRNQLSYLPDTICQLTRLKSLVVNNNKLVSLPEEIGKMQSLTELDACCNEITHLPVQIGDMTSLRSLNLRRNHLQEVPVEMAFLRLIHLDLSGNRIANLPVELRFITSLVKLELGENPLSCPPANLCSRGKVHVFKYLEIQAIKEDRKRGILTDSEYRRSCRKTTSSGGQLNDFRFATSLGGAGDSRLKRHTADSGYGSEQPLDRRWSQDFSQDAIDMHTEDARRIIMRAANCPRSPQRPIGVSGPSGSISSTNCQILNVIGSRASTTVSSPPVLRPPLPPLTSTGSNSSSSSGHSSLSVPPTSSTSSPVMDDQDAHPTSSPSPLSTNSDTAATCEEQRNNFVTSTRHCSSASSLLEATFNNNSEGNAKLVSAADNSMCNSEGQLLVSSDTTDGSSSSIASRGGSPQREDHRRGVTTTTHKVPGRRGNNSFCGPGLSSSCKPRSLPSIATAASSPRHAQPLSPPSNGGKILLNPVGSLLPVPVTNSSSQQKPQQVQTTRQMKESFRRQNATKPLATDGSTAISDSNENSCNEHSSGNRQPPPGSWNRMRSSHYSYSSSSNPSSSLLSPSSVTRQQTSTAAFTETTTTNGGRKTSYNVKAMQKEAVLSYVKAKQSNNPVHQDSSIERRSASPRPVARNGMPRGVATSLAPGMNNTSRGIPQPSSGAMVLTTSKVYQNKSLLNQANVAKQQYCSTTTTSQPVRKDNSCFVSPISTTSDAHIAQLKTTIESRLRISLPEGISGALADGVILCHLANHVKPRSVTSIHVPSAAVPKLTQAKCKRNVENFLLSCKKLGVREDLICSPGDISEPRKQGTVRVAITVSELLRFYQPRQAGGGLTTLPLSNHPQIGLQM